MIVASLLLILAAVALLVLGLVDGSSQLLVGSIAASLLAAIALVIGARQSAAARATGSDHGDRHGGARDAGPALAPARERVAAGVPGRPPHDWTAASDATTESFPAVPPQGGPEMTGSGPAMAPASAMGPPPQGVDLPSWSPIGTDPIDTDPPDDEVAGDEDPPDEPPAQQVLPAAAAQVAQMSTMVLVVDGRPRYHLAGCVHLVGKDSEPLPVAEAVELGFTPCSRCEPDTALLAGAR